MKSGRLFLLIGFTIASLNSWALPGDFVELNRVRLEKLFTSLDAEHEGIGKLVEEWNKGNRLDAATGLAGYLETRSTDEGLLPPMALPADYKQRAERALDNTFHLLGDWKTIPQHSDEGIDWNFRGADGDKENAWMLNRHAFLPVLAEVWKETGQQEYREQLNYLWQDWILNSPYPGRLTFSPQWRSLEVARRINNSWIHVSRIAGALDSETHLLMLSSLAEHADALQNHASFWGGNHLITEKLALLTLAAAYPEFSKAPLWQSHAIEGISRELMGQTYPDGSYMELSNHYQRVVLVNAEQFLGILSEIDPQYRELPVYERITAMWDFHAGVMKPDGTGPLNNASDRENNARQILDAWEFHGRSDWLAIATHGAEGTLPKGSASRYFPWAGQVILRDNWSPRADWIYFDAGPYGTAHQHVDRLHVSASLNGRPLLTDAGRYTYKPGPWLDYFKGPESHSLISLDGKPAEQAARKVEKPLPIAFQETEAAVFTGARSQFATDGILPGLEAPVPWIRALLYDKRGFAIILDHVVTFRDHALEARWHFHPEVTDLEAPQALVLHYPESGLTPTLQRGSTTVPFGGFHSPDYNLREPAALLRFDGHIDKPSTLIWSLQEPGSEVVEIQLLDNSEGPVIHLRISGGRHPVAEARIRLYPEPRLLEYTALEAPDS